MSLKLSGLNPLAYMGVEPYQPPQLVTQTFDPTSTDNQQNFNIGTLWVNTTNQNVWMLVKFLGPVATWVKFSSGGISPIETLTGNSGGAVGPTAGNTINFVGDGTTINIAGNPGTNTLTVNVIAPLTVPNGGTGATTLTAHGVLLGEGTSMIVATAVGSTNTVLLGNTGADPSFGTVPNAALTNSSITLTSGTGITVTGSPVSLGGTATIALTVPVSIANGGTNATSMTTTDGTIIFDGTRLVTTATGTANQVLTSNGAGVAPTYQNVSASGAVTSVSGGNNITITGTATAPIVNVSGTTNHSVQIGNATNSLSSVSVGTNGQVLVAATTADPTWVTPAAGTGLSITTNATTLSYALSTPVSIANGGTNATSMATTDGTVIFDGTRLVTTATGTAGQILTSNGAGVAPTYQAAGAVATASVWGSCFQLALNSDAAITYSGFFQTAYSASASLAQVQLVVPMNGTFDRMYVNSTSNGNSVNGTFALNKNGSATALVVTVTANTNAVFSDTTHSVSVSQGDLVCIQASQATTGTTQGGVTIRFTPS
jgi:hypothetical protein